MDTVISILITLLASVVFAIVATVRLFACWSYPKGYSSNAGSCRASFASALLRRKKLFSKENTAVNTAIGTYVFWALIFTFIAGGVFFCGGNLLLCIFIVTLAEMLFIMAAYAARSPYEKLGSSRNVAGNGVRTYGVAFSCRILLSNGKFMFLRFCIWTIPLLDLLLEYF